MKTVLTTALFGLICVGAQAADLQVAMGPDPGGHSGATVTPQTTKTDNKQVDSARETRSGGNTESVDQSKNSAQQVSKEKSSSDVSAQPNTKK